MRIFLKKVFFFVCFLLIFYSGCVFLWGLIFPSKIAKNVKYELGAVGHLHRRVQDLANFTNVDILFLGSSHTYRGFDPRVFMKDGITSFNLGSSAQTPIQTEVLVNQYLHSLNPRLVVYEVYPDTLSYDGIESGLDLIANGKIDLFTIKMALALKHVTVYNTLIYGIIRDFFNLDSDFFEPIQKHKDTYVKGGYVENEISFFENNETFPLKRWEFNKHQKKTFERILNNFKKLKFNVILVQAPLTKELFDSYTNNSEVENYFKSLAPYYNFNDILELSSTKHFYDSQHLNQNGVEIFNKALLNILKNNKYI